MESDVKADPRSSITCIFSKNVFIGSEMEPASAIIMVNQLTGKITEIKRLLSNQPELDKIIDDHKKKYNLIDVGDLFIIPGVRN